MRVADVALPVDVVLRRPVAVAPGGPGAVIGVQRDGVVDPEGADGLLHVFGHVLECELRSVHAHDDEARVPVGLGPTLHVGQRADAVDAGIRPEVDQDDLAAERREGERLGVEPLPDPAEIGSLPVVLQLAALEMALARQEGVDAILSGCALLQTLQRLRVAGHVGGELHVEAESHDDRHRHDHAAERAADQRRPGAQSSQVHPPLRRDGEEQQNESGPERVRQRHEHALDREALRRRQHGDRRDHRPGTGREEEPEADAQQEPAPQAARVAPPERLEWPLDERAEPRPEERETHQEDDSDGDVAKEVVGEPERREERRRHEREQREAPHEPRDDRVGPPPVARSPAGEDDWQNRQDTGRDRRDDASHERDADKQAHGVIMPA